MPASPPDLDPSSATVLADIGSAIRRRRKELGVSAVAAAEAAGISRVTLHRIEHGLPSITVGAYLRVAEALGLQLTVAAPSEAAAADRRGWLPARIRIADYPWLKQLAWQVQGPQALSPREALGIYERNWRHVDAQTLTAAEQDLVDALRAAFANEPHV